MKKLIAFLLLPAFIAVCSLSCNNGDAGKTDGKVTDLPVTTKSKEAMASFQEGLAAFDLNDIEKARAAFGKAIEQDAGLGIAYLYMANTATSAKEFADNVNTGKIKMDSASN